MITFRKLTDRITGSVNGKPFSLPKTDGYLNDLQIIIDTLEGGDMNPDEAEVAVMALSKGSRKAVIAASCPYLMYNPMTSAYYLALNNEKVSDHQIPEALQYYLEYSHEHNIDVLPVVKAWTRFLKNPKYSKELGEWFQNYLTTDFTDYNEVDKLVEEGYTNEAAVNIAKYKDIAITQEGLLATYKVAEIVTWEYTVEEDEFGNFVTKKNNKPMIPPVVCPTTGAILEPAKMAKPEFKEDLIFTPAIWKNGDKFYSGDVLGYVYKVGEVQRLPKEAKRNYQNTFGGGGLYIGGLAYIAGYRSSGTHVLTCFVDPADIISFQAEGSAIRVNALMPNNVWDETIPLRGLYHSSTYAALSTQRLEEMLAEIAKDEAEAEAKKAAKEENSKL